MNDESRLTFEEELKGNTALRKAVEEVKALYWTIENHDIIELHQILKQAQSETQPPLALFDAKRHRFSLSYIWLVAASILFVVGVWYLLQPPEAERLYHANYQKHPIETSKESDLIAATPAAREAEGVRLYKEGKFDEAYAAFTSLEMESDNPQTYQLYKGLTALANEEVEVAIKDLEEAYEHDISLEQSKNRQIAAWYLGLAYLRQQDMEKAETYFQSLTTFSNPYQSQSMNLLTQLKE